MTLTGPRTISIEIPEELLGEIATLAAEILASAPADAGGERPDGYLPPARAAAYLGVSRQRIHQLTSGRALCPDGRDGRTPLYTRQTLDRYVRECAGRRR
jgi:hypothetical protein